MNRSGAPAGKFTVFISYRRDDSGGYAGRLHDALRERWGDENVRMDVDDIAPGADFIQAAHEMVASSDILLVLIAKRWMEGRNAERLADPADLLRQEIETALEKGVRVIPVLLNGASLPATEALPPSLVPLLARNAFELSERRWAYDVEDLVTTVERLPGRAERVQQREPLPADQQHAPDSTAGIPPTCDGRKNRVRLWARAALALLITAAVVLGIQLLMGLGEPPEMASASATDTVQIIAVDQPDLPALEDCRGYNPRALKIQGTDTTSWLLTDGAYRMAYLDTRADAERALALAKRYTEHCFIGRHEPWSEFPAGDLRYPDDARYVTDYWLGDSGIASTVGDEDCTQYSPAALKVVERTRSGPRWALQDQGSGQALAQFDSLADANRALLVAREATQICFIGKNNSRRDAESYIVEYWR